MANDPGWGNRNNGGPPDLDEVLRQFGRKLNGLFGRSNKSGPSTPSPDHKALTILPIIGLIGLIWIATGFYIVDQGSRGVVLRFGKHVETTLPGPRWHIPYPIEGVTIVNMQQVRILEVGYRSVEGGQSRSKELRESLMLTDDENIIDLQFAVQYNLKSVRRICCLTTVQQKNRCAVWQKLPFVRLSARARWTLPFMKVVRKSPSVRKS